MFYIILRGKSILSKFIGISLATYYFLLAFIFKYKYNAYVLLQNYNYGVFLSNEIQIVTVLLRISSLLLMVIYFEKELCFGLFVKASKVTLLTTIYQKLFRLSQLFKDFILKQNILNIFIK